MKKPILIFAIGVFLVMIGIGLSVYGSQLIIENLATEEKNLGIGKSVEVTKDLDPNVNENGVYVVQITDFKQAHIAATIFDPLGQIVISKTVEHNPYQDIFKISSAGTYKLLVENSGERDVDITAVMGYLPQDKSLTVSIFGFIVIILGLAGLIVGIIYFIKSRKKTNIS